MQSHNTRALCDRRRFSEDFNTKAEAQKLTNAVATNISRGAVDASELFPALPPALIDALCAERKQQKQGIACKPRQGFEPLMYQPVRP